MEDLTIQHTPRDPLEAARLRVAALISSIEDPNRRPGVGPHLLDETKRRTLARMGLVEATE